jgi:hypothetical protein
MSVDNFRDYCYARIMAENYPLDTMMFLVLWYSLAIESGMIIE